jgi:hypothetical protein
VQGLLASPLQRKQVGIDGATSIAGLRLKKPVGFSMNPILSTGITGQSSSLGM